MDGFRRIPCVIQRGGTSKGVSLHARDLPVDPGARERVVLAIFGSPDTRQIDGLGGADPLTSKVAIIGPPTRPDADVDYTFGAVGIAEAKVDFRGNCGNISSAVGPFAIDEGLVAATDPVTRVRIHNTNTGRILIARVRTRGGRARYTGEVAIDGVPGTSAPIELDYSATAGSATGRLLPTGHAIDRIRVDGVGEIEVSIVDAGNPVVFMRPEPLGLTGAEGPSDPLILAALDAIERIRGAAAAMIGMVADAARARSEIPSIPMLALIREPAGYESFADGHRIDDADVDFVARLFYMQVMHKTYAGTGTVATGVAARIPGTIVERAARPASRTAKTVRIGHPAGVITIDVDVASRGGNHELRNAAFVRTSRRILEGAVWVADTAFSGAATAA